MSLTKVSGSILKDPLNLGAVSIDGTLTYEDVTNVDSLGVGTFRTGIHVGAGISVVGLSTFNSGVNVSGVSTFNNIVKINTTGTSELTSIYNNNAASLVINDTGAGAQIVLRGQSPKLIFDQTAGGNGSIYYDSTDLIFYAGVPEGAPADVEKVRFTHGGINVSGVVTATSFSGSGEDLTYTTQLSHRNIFHNGEFKVIQRYGTSFAINSSSDSEFTFDRWYAANHDNLGNFTASQEADAPAGFKTSVKIQCTSTDSSSSGSEQSFIQQTVEAQNVSHIFNSSSSQPMTLSFYYKSNATTTRQLWFFTPDSSRHYSALFTPSATNTWERITIPIPADTANTVNDDNGAGFYVRFMIGAGTVYKNGRPTSWQNLSNDRYSGVTNLCTNTANNFYITGVQLEMGSKSTPYEHRTFSEELVNCQRYYYPYKSILKGASSGGNRPWVPVQLFLNSASSDTVFVVIAGLNEQRAKMRTGSAEVRILAPLNSAPVTSAPSAGEWAYFYRGQGSGYYSGGTAFTWNDGYYNMYGVKSSANPRPTQIMIETNSEVGKVYVELDDEI